MINISQLKVHHFTFRSIFLIKTLSVSLCYKVNILNKVNLYSWIKEISYNSNLIIILWQNFYSLFQPYSTWGGAYMSPYHISAIFSGSTYPRRLQLCSKFKFCNYLAHKIGLVSEKFSYGLWEALKVGRVVHFLLRFCLKIDYNFTFTERRWNFLVEILI